MNTKQIDSQNPQLKGFEAIFGNLKEGDSVVVISQERGQFEANYPSVYAIISYEAYLAMVEDAASVEQN